MSGYNTFINGIPNDVVPVSASGNHLGSNIIGFICAPTSTATAGTLGITTIAGEERDHPFQVNMPYFIRLTHVRTIPADISVSVYVV